MDLTLTDLEQAINFWRAQRPSTGEERALSAEVNALAGIYAMMIFNQVRFIPSSQLDPISLALIEDWRKHHSRHPA